MNPHRRWSPSWGQAVLAGICSFVITLALIQAALGPRGPVDLLLVVTP
ncbi:hypothetical protein [Nocardiopsis sp. YSL2]|nr:hypothetical protein [Nocardiopsis sp. YSL2]